MLANHSRCLSEKMNITSVTYCMLLVIIMTLTRCTATSRLSLWIDEAQVQSIVGLSTTLPFNLYIIYKGNVTPYLNDNGFDASLPVLPHEIDTVNLTWEAGDEQFTYWFDNLKSRNKTILYNPLLSIPASGIIPKGPKIFQISIPCTGTEEGVAHLILGLQIMDQHGKPIKGSPIKLRLKKQCFQFESTTLCEKPCTNNGRCNQNGDCECRQGFHGPFCELDMCNPSCKNNGTCISPDMCLCLDGFFGKQCEKALCITPCQNGGHCVQTGVLQPGICWCTSGFFGDACEFSYCQSPCKHGGICIGNNKCQCKTGYSGSQCEKGTDRKRRSEQKKKVERLKEEKRKKKCTHAQTEMKKKCNKAKNCKSKQDKVLKQCLLQKDTVANKCKKLQAKFASKCVGQKDRPKKRCDKMQLALKKTCTSSSKKSLK